MKIKLEKIKLEFELDAYQKGFDPTKTAMHKLLVLLIEEWD